MILEGYQEGLAKPAPRLLDEQESWMRPYVACSDEERRDFWHEVKHYREVKNPPPEVASMLETSLPKGAKLKRFASLRKGGGSLGRPRYVAIAAWAGGQVVREAKALVPSAWDWAHGNRDEPKFLELARGPFRAPDPHLDLVDRYIVRRIAPDQRKIDLGDRTGVRLRLDLLWAMGFDLGAVHAAKRDDKKQIERHLRKQKDDGWLQDAAKRAAVAVQGDFEEWKKVRLPVRR
ncbi:hypothetical protein ACVIU7_001617 [Bradyrhizobium liaoningense]|uniref:hypothetical protein n=1 Tax=Bradyrhizobium TaxID=374 RepID=UPI0004269414|nr:hypothetical protein [Bradyrhizobium japonicum]